MRLSGQSAAATLFEGSVALLASHHGFADSPVDSGERNDEPTKWVADLTESQ